MVHINRKERTRSMLQDHIDNNNWRLTLPGESRDMMVERIMDTSQRCQGMPPTEHGRISFDDLCNAALAVEERVFILASIKRLYYRMISCHMLQMERKVAVQRKQAGIDNQVAQATDIPMTSAVGKQIAPAIDIQTAQASTLRNLQDPGEPASFQTVSDDCLRKISWFNMASRTGGLGVRIGNSAEIRRARHMQILATVANKISPRHFGDGPNHKLSGPRYSSRTNSEVSRQSKP